MSLGPSFVDAWSRFLQWIDALLNSTVSDDIDVGRAPTILENPSVALVAHNGFRFDFPFLLCELLRHNLDVQFEQWYFIDTLVVFGAINHGCLKLQCLARDAVIDAGNAHRALDDSIALRNVSIVMAQRLGITSKQLLSMFLCEFDLASSCVLVCD